MVIRPERVGKRLARDADGRTSGDIAVFNQFVNDGLGDGYGNGEAQTFDAGRGIVRAHLHRVDAHDLPVAVDKRAAGVAVVERGIGLNQRHRTVAHRKVPIDGGNNAVCHRAAQLYAERVADGHDRIAHTQLARIAELRRLQAGGVHFKHCDIARFIAADQHGVILVIVAGQYRDHLCIFNDVVVGDNVAVGGHDDARAAGRARGRGRGDRYDAADHPLVDLLQAERIVLV